MSKLINQLLGRQKLIDQNKKLEKELEEFKSLFQENLKNEVQKKVQKEVEKERQQLDSLQKKLDHHLQLAKDEESKYYQKFNNLLSFEHRLIDRELLIKGIEKKKNYTQFQKKRVTLPYSSNNNDSGRISDLKNNNILITDIETQTITKRKVLSRRESSRYIDIDDYPVTKIYYCSYE